MRNGTDDTTSRVVVNHSDYFTSSSCPRTDPSHVCVHVCVRVLSV